LHFKVENTPIKTQMEGKFEKNVEIPFCGQGKGFRYEIVLRGIQPCFLHGEALGLFLTNQGSEVFLKKFQVHSALCGRGKHVLKREFLFL